MNFQNVCHNQWATRRRLRSPLRSPAGSGSGASVSASTAASMAGLNGHKDDMEDSRPNSPFERPSSRNTVEITLTGRTRSRQDLCPDRPRSKFEHAV